MSLRPNDRVRFLSSRSAKLNFDTVVGTDGSVWLPGEVMLIVAGMKWDDLISEIKKGLENAGFDTKQLEIQKLGSASLSVEVVGAVRNPGSLPWHAGLRLADIVFQAKPLNRADLDKIEIRDRMGKVSIHRYVSLDTTTKGWNVAIRQGDTVTFPQMDKAAEISILGEVLQAGKVDFSTELTLRSAIGLAGGISGNGNPEAIEIYRDDQLIKVANITAGDEISLQRGDRIVVPKRKIQGWVSVLGEVGKQGQYAYKEGMRLTDAINLAAGFSSFANKAEITITRQANGKFERLKFSYEKILKREQENPILMPGDSVEVKARIRA